MFIKQQTWESNRICLDKTTENVLEKTVENVLIKQQQKFEGFNRKCWNKEQKIVKNKQQKMFSKTIENI